MTKLLLVDGDGIIYRCGFAVEHTRYLLLNSEGMFRIFDGAKEARSFAENDWKNWDPTIWSRKEVEPYVNAEHLVNSVLVGLSERFSPCNIRLYLSPKAGNYRDSIATFAKYKGNRDGAPRPVYYRELTEYLVKNYETEYAIGQEADDSLGIALTGNSEAVCVSFDKDLLQVPGQHFNWVEKTERTVGRKEGALAFWTQVLAGDATDNVPGIEGCGPRTAEKVLADVKSDKEAWEVTLNKYKEVYGEDEGLKRAVETARLVYIRRQEGEIWNPPN